MSRADRLALAELAERPPRIAPPLPDLESTAPYWHGPASLWRRRALASERALAELRALIRGWEPLA